MSVNYQKMFDSFKGVNCLPQMDTPPEKERLFGEFFYKNDFAVLLGPESSGRSILAMQLADSISRGVQAGGFALDGKARQVVFVDLEGNHDAFARRYSLNGKNPYPFHDNFNLVRFHGQFKGYTRMRKDFIRELKSTVAPCKDGVLIINNLDYWKCFMPENYILAAIKELQARYNLSVLLIAALKGSAANKQLTPGRAGKLLTTMTDSIFAMNYSTKNPDMRYLMQLKTKGGTMVYNNNHVAEFVLGREHNFTGCRFTGFGTEQQHITEPATGLDLKIIELSADNPGLRMAEVADQLKTNKKRVERVLKKHESAFAEASADKLKAFGRVVTSTFINDAAIDATSFNNPRLQPGDGEGGEDGENGSHPVGFRLHGSDGLAHGNDETPPPANNYREDMGLPDIVFSKGEIELLAAVVTSTFINDADTDDASFSNPRLQTGDDGNENGGLSHGNDAHPVKPEPFLETRQVDVKKVVNGITSSLDGQQLFEEMAKAFSMQERLMLDMEGINGQFSTAFLDSSFGRMVEKFTFEYLREKIMFKNYKESQVNRLDQYLDRYRTKPSDMVPPG